MEVQNFISVLTECIGDRHYKCVTRCQIWLETLTLMITSRAAPFAAKNLEVGPDSLSDQRIKEKAEAHLEREVEKRVCKCCRTFGYVIN